MWQSQNPGGGPDAENGYHKSMSGGENEAVIGELLEDHSLDLFINS
jgi:hypothetical protein